MNLTIPHRLRLIGVLVLTTTVILHDSIPAPGFHPLSSVMLRVVTWQVIADASDDLSGRKRSDPAQAVEVGYFTGEVYGHTSEEYNRVGIYMGWN